MLVRVGEKFPGEKEKSQYSPGVVSDDEIVERRITRRSEILETGEPSTNAFMMNQLLGKSGSDPSVRSGLSVNRVRDTKRYEKVRSAPISELPASVYARVGDLRKIADEEGNRTVSVVDAGTEDNPLHAEIFIHPTEEEDKRGIRAKIMKAFRGEGVSRGG